MKNSWFIVAPDTDTGKTYITALLFKQLTSLGVNAAVMKPIQTGAISEEGRLISEDLLFCYNFAGLPYPEVERVHSPYLFEMACSPHWAARKESVHISIEQILAAHEEIQKEHDIILIESAGGFLSPLSETMTNRELAQEMQAKVILLSPNRLGAISQTLSLIEQAEAANLSIEAIVMNDIKAPSDSFSEELLAENCRFIKNRYQSIPLCRIPYGFKGSTHHDDFGNLVNNMVLKK